ncbi:MAG: hypothetical protein ACOY4R_26655 [Pseudomonadota bacterium]
MPRIVLAAGLLLVAWASAAQAQVAQQCAAFGQMQYRKLDRSVDQVQALEFPPPALERVEAPVGSQAVAAALTLRGRVTYRNRAPLETHFVCLLDRSDRPLFFYALPVLGARPAPTPMVRGAPAAPPPPAARSVTVLPLSPSAPEPPRAPAQTAGQAAGQTAGPRSALPAGTARLRGLVRDAGGHLQFLPCDGGPLLLEDRTPGQELLAALRALTAGREGRPMFVELYGGRQSGPAAGITALELRRAAVETAGCRERFDQREWMATGNEPSWRAEVTARDMVVSVLGEAAAQRVPHDGPHREGATLVYASPEAPETVVLIEERRCIDSQSGSLFAYAVEARSEGQVYRGCAAHSPAMPAP